MFAKNLSAEHLSITIYRIISFVFAKKCLNSVDKRGKIDIMQVRE
jgi:hypothetical protein